LFSVKKKNQQQCFVKAESKTFQVLRQGIKVNHQQARIILST